MAKPSIGLPQGTRDFGPAVVRKRNFIFQTIKQVFEVYGFQPLETPAMENIETLMGKYGEEGDKLIFKILNNGLGDEANASTARRGFEQALLGRTSKDLTMRALKYDLTIPFARYVAMNYNQLVLPFKRYQVQPVWRADRPQRGRYREFYQCDADVVGSTSLLNEVELATIYDTVFKKLGIDIEIKINSRKILAALAEQSAGIDRLTDITIAIDKLDKIGLEKVEQELMTRGLDEHQVTIIRQFLEIKGDNLHTINKLKELFGASNIGAKGIEELEYVLQHLPADVANNISVDLTLARGLNYYTGLIFEVKARQVQMGSIGGGGRYDDLTGLFGVPNVPGVGISFGVDRIYDVMEELSLFPAEVFTGTQVLFFNLGEKESEAAFTLLQELREREVRSEMYHEQARFDKQFKYAERKNIPYIIIIGSQELAAGTCTVKDLRDGRQQSISFNNLANFAFI